METIIIKFGSGCEFTEDHAKQIKEMVEQGKRIVFVVSGAIRIGNEMWFSNDCTDERIRRKVSAASGQIPLINKYAEVFKKVGIKISQILVTYESLKNPESAIALKEVLERINNRTIVLINYDDPVSMPIKKHALCRIIKKIKGNIFSENNGEKVSRLISEYRLDEELFKDNDCLAAIFAVLLGASYLIIITDQVKGFLNENRELIRYMPSEDIKQCKKNCIGKGGEFNTGGMFAKFVAAEILLSEVENSTVIIGNSQCGIVELINDEISQTRIKRNSIRGIEKENGLIECKSPPTKLVAGQIRYILKKK